MAEETFGFQYLLEKARDTEKQGIDGLHSEVDQVALHNERMQAARASAEETRAAAAAARAAADAARIAAEAAKLNADFAVRASADADTLAESITNDDAKAAAARTEAEDLQLKAISALMAEKNASEASKRADEKAESEEKRADLEVEALGKKLIAGQSKTVAKQFDFDGKKKVVEDLITRCETVLRTLTAYRKTYVENLKPLEERVIEMQRMIEEASRNKTSASEIHSFLDKQIPHSEKNARKLVEIKKYLDDFDKYWTSQAEIDATAETEAKNQIVSFIHTRAEGANVRSDAEGVAGMTAVSSAQQGERTAAETAADPQLTLLAKLQPVHRDVKVQQAEQPVVHLHQNIVNHNTGDNPREPLDVIFATITNQLAKKNGVPKYDTLFKYDDWFAKVALAVDAAYPVGSEYVVPVGVATS